MRGLTSARCWALKAKLAWVGRGNPGGSHELEEEEGIGWGLASLEGRQ